MTGPRRRRATPESGPSPVGSGEATASPVTPRQPTAQTGEVGEAASPVAPRRRKRASVGGFHSKLEAPTRAGETRRWVNDDAGRIDECRELGYEFVSEKGIQTADPGSRISRLVGTKANGEPLHAYLMETPDELFAQGQTEREASCRLIDEAITAGRDSTGRMDEHQYGQGSIKSDR